jgi:NACalpha-BTF3-like transcription factor
MQNFSWSSGSNCAKQHHFEKMINNIKKIDGIDKVTRVYKRSNKFYFVSNQSVLHMKLKNKTKQTGIFIL